jgi:putative ABC transport system permease protein
MSAKGGPNPLWARSPLVLRRYPGLLVAVVAGALLLAVAAASSPLFLSSAASSAMRQEVEDVTVFGAGFSLEQRDYFGQIGAAIQPAVDTPAYPERDEAITKVAAEIPGLEERILTLLGVQVRAAPSDQPERSDIVRLLYRTDALAHVTKLEGGEGEGVWLSDNRAEQLGVGPGDTLTLTYEGDVQRDGRRHVGTTSVVVAGVYRALWSEPDTPYWRDLYEQIYPPNPDVPPPPAFLIMDEATYREVNSDLESFATDVHWEFPLADPSPTLEQAQSLNANLDQLQASLQARTTPEARTLSCTELRCATATLLPTVIRETEEEVSALRGPADLLATAGTLVALAVVAAAGAFLVARRRTEAMLLHARGMSPWVFAGKTLVETFLPVLVGTALGFLVAVGVISLVGPGGAVDPAALLDAAQAAALRLPAALFVLALVAGLVYLGLSERNRDRAGLLRFIPWEIGLLVAAAFCFERLTGGHGLVEEAGGVERPSAYVLLFPIFFVAGLAGLVARLWGPALRGLRRRSTRLPAGPYLAVHRLAGAERLAVLLVAACALSLGIFVYAQTVVYSLERSVLAKSALFVGSNVNGTINTDQEPPADFPFPITKVTRIVRGGEATANGTQVDLMAVDPATLAEAAFWDPSWSDASFGGLAERLAAGTGAAIPVVVAGDRLPDETQIVVDSAPVPIQVVGRASAFPGMFESRPLVVASYASWERAFDDVGISSPLDAPGADAQLWVKGDDERAAAALTASPVRPYQVLTSAEIRQNPSILSATRTFDFLRALGFAAGLLAVVGMLLYLQARQRGRVVSFALSRRMGLAGPVHVAALVLELGAMLLSSLAIGIALALVAARVVLGDVDPLADIPPDPLFSTPVSLLVATAIGLALVSVLGGLLASRAAERANVSEVMRLAD